MDDSTAAPSEHKQVQDKIDFDLGNTKKVSPFSIACQRGHLATVELLLKYSDQIDFNSVDDGSNSALYHVCSQNRVKVAELLISHPDVDPYASSGSWTPLFAACARGCDEIVRLLLTHHALDLRDESSKGRTVLWIAAHNGRREVVKVLMASGKNLAVEERIPDEEEGEKKKGMTAKEAAKDQNFEDIAELIEKYEQDRTKSIIDFRKELGIEGTNPF